MKKAGLRIALFLLSAVLLLGFTTYVLKEKTEELRRFQNLHSLERDAVDVLIIGSSHAHCSFYTNVLWSEYGIASYMMGCGRQTFWDSWHVLQDALRTQRPKLLILEAYGICLAESYEERMFAFGNTDGLRWSKNKVDAIRTATSKEDFLSFLTVFPLFHRRYYNLTRADFVFRSPNPYSKGTTFHTSRTPCTAPDIPVDAQPAPVPEKAEVWYRKIIETVREEGIPLLIVAAPFRHSDLQYGQLLTARDIAAEYGIPFLNTNDYYSSMGIDYTTCFADETHLNFIGGPLFTKYIADYLNNQYDLPDRRGNAAYASWETDAAVLERKTYNHSLQDEKDLPALLSRFRDPSYLTVVSFGGQCTDTDEGLQPCIRELNLDTTGAGGIRVVSGGETLRVCLPGEEAFLPVGEYDFYFKSEADDETSGIVNTVLLDHVPVPETPEHNGMTVTIYDLQLGEVVVSALTWRNNGYNGFDWTK